MKSSEIIERARSLADIPNSKYIDNTDESQSLWEAYKDIYSKFTDSSDDYYMDSVMVDTSTATKLGEFEYEVTIPADIYKIRFVDYETNGRWTNMLKFNTNTRNSGNGQPMYRWKGRKLWLSTGGFNGLPTMLRIDYYPPPIRPTVPVPSVEYCTAIAPYDLSKVTCKQYIDINGTDFVLYLYNGTSIYVESKVNNTRTLLYTGVALSFVTYFGGYIYYIATGNIYRAPSTLLATIVPAAIISTGTAASIMITGQKLYYIIGANTNEANLDGSNPVQVMTAHFSDACTFGGELAIITAGGFISVNGTVSTIAALHLACDGTNLIYSDSLGNINKILDYGTADQTVEIIGYGYNMSGGDAPYLTLMITEVDYKVNTLSTITDTDFDYPVNEANELLAYQCAIDFKRKAQGDTVALQGRYQEILDRFTDVIKRDEYQTERRMPEYVRPIGW